ncbi:unnamed protein product, partial [Staurois parvus]
MTRDWTQYSTRQTQMTRDCGHRDDQRLRTQYRDDQRLRTYY